MAEPSPSVEEKGYKHGEAKEDYDIENVPVYDDAGPVEFAEKAELRLVTTSEQAGYRLTCCASQARPGTEAYTNDRTGTEYETCSPTYWRRANTSQHQAGAIGTGLFLSSGKAIVAGGPLGAFLGYLFVGMLVTGPVFSIAEMSALVPYVRFAAYEPILRHVLTLPCVHSLSGGIIRYAYE